ncbi:MAG: DUF484 family protein [Thermodesulfobacteriota bacterium]
MADRPKKDRSPEAFPKQDPTGESSRLRAYALEASAKIEEVRRHYRQLLKEAELVYLQNEKAFNNIRRIRYKLIGARSLAELLTILFKELADIHLDHASLSLINDVVDQNGEAVTDLPVAISARLIFINRETLRLLFPSASQGSALIGAKEQVDRLSLFGPDIMSCVLAPLHYHGTLIGCLNLGSRSTTRFAADRSPVLLEDLANTAALCLDNVLAHERNEQLASTDPLTGAYNRRYFYECVARNADLADRYGDSLCCLYIDMNYFKQINDRYGHDLGDLALKKLTQLIKERIRRTDVLARMGGDEFAVLLPRVDLEKARVLTESLRRGLAGISFAEEGYPELRLSASFGVATAHPQEGNLRDLITRADQAMYQDKKKTKGE